MPIFRAHRFSPAWISRKGTPSLHDPVSQSNEGPPLCSSSSSSSSSSYSSSSSFSSRANCLTATNTNTTMNTITTPSMHTSDPDSDSRGGHGMRQLRRVGILSASTSANPSAPPRTPRECYLQHESPQFKFTSIFAANAPPPFSETRPQQQPALGVNGDGDNGGNGENGENCSYLYRTSTQSHLRMNSHGHLDSHESCGFRLRSSSPRAPSYHITASMSPQAQREPHHRHQQRQQCARLSSRYRACNVVNSSNSGGTDNATSSIVDDKDLKSNNLPTTATTNASSPNATKLDVAAGALALTTFVVAPSLAALQAGEVQISADFLGIAAVALAVLVLELAGRAIEAGVGGAAATAVRAARMRWGGWIKIRRWRWWEVKKVKKWRGAKERRRGIIDMLRRMITRTRERESMGAGTATMAATTNARRRLREMTQAGINSYNYNDESDLELGMAGLYEDALNGKTQGEWIIHERKTKCQSDKSYGKSDYKNESEPRESSNNSDIGNNPDNKNDNNKSRDSETTSNQGSILVDIVVPLVRVFACIILLGAFLWFIIVILAYRVSIAANIAERHKPKNAM